jgi:hypothetical protein
MRRKIAAALAVTGALAVPAAAEAQGPPVVIGGGLVNVQVVDLIDGDVLSDNNVGVGVAAGVAAQVCGVQAQVGVIARQLARGDDFSCTNDAGTQGVDITQD